MTGALKVKGNVGNHSVLEVVADIGIKVMLAVSEDKKILFPY